MGEEIATVTVTRSTLSGLMDITIALAYRGGDWVITDSLSEQGDQVILTEPEEQLAQCLVKAGVDETGR